MLNALGRGANAYDGEVSRLGNKPLRLTAEPMVISTWQTRGVMSQLQFEK